MTRTSRGVSLIELLLTLSACSVLLTLSAGLIHRVMHVQSKTRAYADVERNALRLANAFRQDVHAAEKAVNGDSLPAGVVLRLELPGDETIEYRHEAGIVSRVGLAGEAVKSREIYSFPAEIEPAIEQDSPRLVIFTITTPAVTAAASSAEQRPVPAYATPVALRVAAVLGRDQPSPVGPAEEEQSP